MSKFNTSIISTIALLVALEYEPDDISPDLYIYVSAWDGIVGCLKPDRNEKKEDEIGTGFYVVSDENLLEAREELRQFFYSDNEDDLHDYHQGIQYGGLDVPEDDEFYG